VLQDTPHQVFWQSLHFARTSVHRGSRWRGGRSAGLRARVSEESVWIEASRKGVAQCVGCQAQEFGFSLQTVPGQIDSEFIGLSTVCCDVGESGKVGVIELHETGVPGGY
jgi:hypothetical protein